MCEEKFGIKCGEMFVDGCFILKYVECFVSCGTVLMMQVNDDYYENLIFSSVVLLLDGW